MKTFALSLAVCGALCCKVCGADQSALATGAPAAAAVPARPAKFQASLEGFGGASYNVSLAADGSLVYLHNPKTFTAQPGTVRTVVKVTPEQWAAFSKKLDKAKIWSWEKDYTNNKVLDGTVWKAEVVWGDRCIKATGRNAYPDENQFTAFKEAVKELLGGREFK